MPLGRRQQVTTIGVAVVATALALAACSSSSSSSTPASSGSGAAASSASSSSAAVSGTLNGSGSTLQLVYQQAAIAAFKSVQSGMTVNYGGGGSGKGRTDLASGVVNYAGSDSPIPATEQANFKGKTVLYFPDRDRARSRSRTTCPASASPEAVGAGHREHLPGQDHDVERLGDRGGQPRGHPAEHRDHHRRPLGLLGHHAELLPVPRRWPRGAAGRSAPARPSTGPPPPAPATATAGWRQIIKSTPGAIGYVDYADAKASGLTFASVKNKAGNYVAPSVAVGLRRRQPGHRRAQPDVQRDLGARRQLVPDHLLSRGFWSTKLSRTRTTRRCSRRGSATWSEPASNCFLAWATRRCPLASQSMAQAQLSKIGM